MARSKPDLDHLNPVLFGEAGYINGEFYDSSHAVKEVSGFSGEQLHRYNSAPTALDEAGALECDRNILSPLQLAQRGAAEKAKRTPKQTSAPSSTPLNEIEKAAIQEKYGPLLPYLGSDERKLRHILTQPESSTSQKYLEKAQNACALDKAVSLHGEEVFTLSPNLSVKQINILANTTDPNTVEKVLQNARDKAFVQEWANDPDNFLI